METLYLGDIHGNFDFVKWYVKAHDIRDCSIVQVGDFGIGFKPNAEGYMLEMLNKTLNGRNVTLYAIRGNHDNPAFFDGTFKEYDRIRFMPDYSTSVIDGKNHLFVGGAISIDRKYRVKGTSYWEDEAFVLDEEKLKGVTGIDVLVTHNSMAFLPPLSFNRMVLDYGSEDKTLLNELLEERALITRMWDILTKENGNEIQLHVFGHFHWDETNFIDNTKHVLLGINKIYVHRH
jgi:hypothetical protein